ncbi:hypothetical protein Xbed_00373 [Xenorhabdus beddingii]|uniref:Uncharacterized protein n=1 Tax=Xenorhabdus beddingii TaxID=40578 RepID=A0A1Y2SUJ2_9GAMM|nr:hypothetical protein Xbed_00373 [Xenorhabdus beddingii]
MPVSVSKKKQELSFTVISPADGGGSSMIILLYDSLTRRDKAAVFQIGKFFRRVK